MDRQIVSSACFPQRAAEEVDEDRRRQMELGYENPECLTESVFVVMPTLNEENAIHSLVRDLRDGCGFRLELLVVDGHSTDRTVEIARKAGANVFLQRSRGKGTAMVEAVEKAGDCEICVFLDGDGTYLPRDLPKIVKPVLDRKADMVIGSRLRGDLEKGAIMPLNMLGNRLYSLLVSTVFRKRISDVLSGYRAVRTDVFRDLQLEGRHFEVEVEMTVKALAKGLRVEEVPIVYRRRRGKPTKLRPFRDGLLIFRTLVSEIAGRKKRRTRQGQ